MKLTTNQVHAYLSANPGRTTLQIARYFGAKVMQVRGCLAQLTRRDETQHIEGRWSIQPPPPTNRSKNARDQGGQRERRERRPSDAILLNLRALVREELNAYYWRMGGVGPGAQEPARQYDR